MKTKEIKNSSDISNYNYKSYKTITEKKVNEAKELLKGVDLSILFESNNSNKK